MPQAKPRHLLNRLAVAFLLVLAVAASMLFAILTFWDVGLPQPRVVGVMHIESIKIAGLTLRGWQIYLSYIIPGTASLLLVAAAFRCYFRAAKT
jgi:hypothetical protein